jgi:hypothetical protein
MSMMSARPLPTAIEEITPQWLTTALRMKYPGVTVRNVEVLDIIRSTCTKIRLRLDLNEEARRAGIPELVVLKGGFEPHSRQLGSLGAMHEREVRGYRDVLSVVKLPSPAMYFADYDADRMQGIIIMEDLAARGVTFCHALKPHTHEQVARRLTALAQFHAKTWASPDSPNFAPGGKWGDLEDFLLACKPFFDVKTSPENWRRFVSSPRGAASSIRFHDREWIVDAFDRVSRFAQTLPHCVLHGDTHLGNLYIDPDGTPGFLDTLASRGPGILEVSYHVSCALDVADRARWEGALVQHYLDELVRNGVDVPGFDEAMRQYGVFLLYGYFIWITTESNYQTEVVNTANAARSSAAMIDHDIVNLIEAL